ncbi:MAG: 50S ribosomal protein L17 [Chloroflexi bacterium]|nr:50S ribosomal protein L17 [Chloroflexota bacterium]MCL5026616.1 50S ribosomal protein L17 [Chloroflexota bacterium]
MTGRKLGRPTGQRLALYRNLVTELLDHEKITTTLPKAKEIQGMAERVITLGKRGDLHARRTVLTMVYGPKIAGKVFEVLAARYADRQGGYTRVIKLEPRQGDAASMARIELVP